MRELRRAAAVGAGLWLTGFGALLLFWWKWDGPAHLRGLFDFLSATWGDGLLLPAAAAVLTYARALMEPAPGDRLTTLAGGVVGGVLGAFTQIQWLRAGDPELNWTLPAPHRFNAAGWYHAAFLVLASALFAALWVSTLYRLGRTATMRWRVLAALVLALILQLAFGMLLLVDNREFTEASRATVVGVLCGFALLVGILIAVAGTRARLRRAGGRG